MALTDILQTIMLLIGSDKIIFQASPYLRGGSRVETIN